MQVDCDAEAFSHWPINLAIKSVIHWYAYNLWHFVSSVSMETADNWTGAYLKMSKGLKFSYKDEINVTFQGAPISHDNSYGGKLKT